MRSVIKAVIPEKVQRLSCFLPRAIHRPLSRAYLHYDPPHDDFSLQAKRIQAMLGLPLGVLLNGQVCKMIRELPDMSQTKDHEFFVGALTDALDNNRREDVIGILRHCTMLADPVSYRVISDKYKFVWFGVPRVASCSIREALLTLDPEARLLSVEPMDQICRRYSEQIQNYFTFGFARHPLDRLWACWQRRIAHPYPGIDLFHGLSLGMDFSAFCEWVVSPWGADHFADRHWLSQRYFLMKPDNTPVDFIGKCENIDKDWQAVSERIGLPLVDLPHTHRSFPPGLNEGPESLYSNLLVRLRERYAEDYMLGDYR